MYLIISPLMQISELIPPRPPVARVVGNEARAVGEYQAQISSVANMLLEEYRRAAAEEDPRNADRIRQKLVYELNISGKYHALKEQLKFSIVKVKKMEFICDGSVIE